MWDFELGRNEYILLIKIRLWDPESRILASGILTQFFILVKSLGGEGGGQDNLILMLALLTHSCLHPFEHQKIELGKKNGCESYDD